MPARIRPRAKIEFSSGSVPSSEPSVASQSHSGQPRSVEALPADRRDRRSHHHSPPNELLTGVPIRSQPITDCPRSPADETTSPPSAVGSLCRWSEAHVGAESRSSAPPERPKPGPRPGLLNDGDRGASKGVLPLGPLLGCVTVERQRIEAGVPESRCGEQGSPIDVMVHEKIPIFGSLKSPRSPARRDQGR